MQEEQKKRFLLNLLYVGSIVALAILALRYLLPWTLPFFIGLGIAILLKPITDSLMIRSTLRRRGAGIFVVSLFYLTLSLLVWLLCGLAYSQLGVLFARLPEDYTTRIAPLLERGGEWLSRIYALFTPHASAEEALLTPMGEGLQNAVTQLSTAALSRLGEMVKNIPLYLLTAVFSVVSSIIISADYRTITSFLMRQLPVRWQRMLCSTKEFLVGTLGKMLRAYAIILGITFAELAFGLWLLRIDAFLPISFVIAVLDILPVIGTGAILIPWALLELLAGDYFTGIGIGVLWGIITLIRNIIEPKIVGDQLGLHPIVTLTAIYAGMRIAGFWGLLAAPVLVLLVKHLNQSGKIRLYREPAPLPPTPPRPSGPKKHR